ncbi:RPAP1 family protein [Besnoitia besnoiti]|uniref:RPAP1 family protein n=1 Tax=Besnoitia besnoiti TaxID=94643 RepID=A0A2A9M513_BESBE|nr:RPAP1 family protein [Besnoitia besnoiti]PFH30697.1 RPAP1 family protein [Besnoitia besnoiti]
MQGQSGKDAAQSAGATSSVRFDLQEAAKLQWANPLGLEDARGGPLEEEDGEWEHQRVQGGVFTGVPAKAGRGTKTRIRIERLRFDFDGKLRSEVFPSQVLWSKLCLLRQAGEESLCSALLANSLPDLTREDPLEYHRGLHHHGDEAALAGYTLGELLQLAQSASRPQAASWMSSAATPFSSLLSRNRSLF